MIIKEGNKSGDLKEYKIINIGWLDLGERAMIIVAALGNLKA